MSRGGKRAGAGPPRKATARRVVVGTRVDAQTEVELRAVAQRNGKSLSQWVWDAIMRHFAADAAQS